MYQQRDEPPADDPFSDTEVRKGMMYISHGLCCCYYQYGRPVRPSALCPLHSTISIAREAMKRALHGIGVSDEPPTTERYERLSGVFCDASPITVRIAMLALGPSFTYTLYIHPRELLSKQSHVREWTGNVEMAHGINVVEDPQLDPFEWYLSANGRRVGSKGA